jgi:hypothetical protein
MKKEVAMAGRGRKRTTKIEVLGLRELRRRVVKIKKRKSGLYKHRKRI